MQQLPSHPLRLNPLIEITNFDCDARQPMLLCSLPAGEERIRFAFPAVYEPFLRKFNGTRDTDAAIADFMAEHPDDHDGDRLRRLVAESMVPKGILLSLEQDPVLAAKKTQPANSFLFVKLPLIGPSVVAPIARMLGFMFTKPALALGATVFALIHLYVYGVLFPGLQTDFNQLDSGTMLALFALSTLSTIGHEFGHASAAAHYGCKRTSIGWGVYIIYTVMWTNVSEAWRLPRHQRAMIDIAGIYFQTWFLAVMLAAYLYTGEPLFLFTFIVIDLAIVATLNPFLRMDGYWLVSDLFGITNMRNQQMLLIRNLISHWFGNGRIAQESGLDPRAQRRLLIYTFLSMFFLAYLLYVIYHMVLLGIITAYPDLLHSLLNGAKSGMPAADLALATLELFWRTIILLATCFALYAMSRSALRLFALVRSVRAQSATAPTE